MKKNLEKIVEIEETKSNDNPKKGIIESVKDYLVDTSAAWSFYTPALAASELLLAGMDSKEVLKSRLYGMGVQALVMRPYAKFRQWWANYWNTNKDSSSIKKFLVDTSATALYQIPVYSAILYESGASFDEASVALPFGVAIGASLGRLYGKWLDKWKKICGRKSTLD